MAVKRTVPGVKKKLTGLSLPTSKSKPSTEFLDYTTIIYGVGKIGKTSLLSHFPNPLFMMFEPGANALSIYQEPCKNWAHFQQYLELLEDNDTFESIVIDTGSLAYDSCFEWVCKEFKVDHPTDVGYGKCWNAIRDEFIKQHTNIANLEMGFVVIAHEDEQEIITKAGNSFTQVVPEFTKQAKKFYLGLMDNVFYYHFDGDKRFLQIRGDDYVFAGTRCEQNFLTTSGDQVFKIPMGNSSKESYDNLMRAFNNGQKNTYKPVRKETKKAPIRRVKK